MDQVVVTKAAEKREVVETVVYWEVVVIKHLVVTELHHIQNCNKLNLQELYTLLWLMGNQNLQEYMIQHSAQLRNLHLSALTHLFRIC